MDNSKTGLIAVGVVGLVLVAGGLLWWSGQTVDPNIDVPDIEVPQDGIAGPDQGGLIRAPLPGEEPEPQGAGINQGGPDTGERAENGEDTGLTREGMIDEMIEDVAKDTGLSEEGRERMREALLRARDGAPPDAPDELP